LSPRDVQVSVVKCLLVQSVYSEIAKGYDAAMMIGQHAMCGVETGNLNHTQCQATIEYYKLNGRLIGEIAQATLLCGIFK